MEAMMTKSPINNPKVQPTDNEAMRLAIEALTEAGIRCTRPHPSQLKVGPLNFYPTKGTIIQDGDIKAWEDTGLEYFISYLLNIKAAKSKIIDLGNLVHE